MSFQFDPDAPEDDLHVIQVMMQTLADDPEEALQAHQARWQKMFDDPELTDYMSDGSGDGGQNEASDAPLYLRLEPGMKVTEIADIHRISVDTLAKLNQLTPGTVYKKEKIVALPTLFHEATADDTLESIAEKYSVEVKELVMWNPELANGWRKIEQGDTFKVPDLNKGSVNEDEIAKATNLAKSLLPDLEEAGNLADPLKGYLEGKTGESLGDLKVFEDSPMPAQFGADAISIKGEVHTGPGKKKHLEHEAIHEIQKKQGRVQPTVQGNNGVGINNDQSLEAEADQKGAEAKAKTQHISSSGTTGKKLSLSSSQLSSQTSGVQRKCAACRDKKVQRKASGIGEPVQRVACEKCQHHGIQAVQAKFTTDTSLVVQRQEITCADEGAAPQAAPAPTSGENTQSPQGQPQAAPGGQAPQNQGPGQTNPQDASTAGQGEGVQNGEGSGVANEQKPGEEEKGQGKEKGQGEGKEKGAEKAKADKQGKGGQKGKGEGALMPPTQGSDKEGGKTGGGESADARAIEFSKLEATPLATQHPTVGGEIQNAFTQDISKTQGELQPLKAEMKGVSEPGKEEFTHNPGNAADPAENTGQEPAPMEPQTHDHHTNEPPKAQAPEEKEEGGFFSRLFDAIGDLLNSLREMLVNIPTQDEGINTSAGDAPAIQLEGKADPQRAETQRQDREQEMLGEQTRVNESIRQHPGPTNVQPLQIEETFEVPQLQTQVPDIQTELDENMQRYITVEMPPEVRQLSDKDMADVLQPHLEGPRGTLESEVSTQEQLRLQTMSENEQSLIQLNTEAQTAQELEVQNTRQSMESEMKRGEEETQKLIQEYKSSADQKQGELQSQVTERVNADNVAAQTELRKGACEAERLQVDAENRAKAEKERAENEEADQSMLERAGDFLGDMWDAVTEAVNNIFEEARQLISSAIEAAQQLATDLIEAGRQWVVEQIDGFRDWLKEQVNTYLADKFPALAEAINNTIDDLANAAIENVNQLAEGLKEGVKALAESLAKAIDDILAAVQAGINTFMDIAGALLSGDFAEALKIMFFALCKAAGIDPNEVMEFINNVGDLISQIFDDPKTFFMNVLDTVQLGLGNFMGNIMSHLGKGLITWLMGPLGKLNITLPETFDLQGILSLTLQVLGLTYENIRSRAVDRIEEQYPGKGEQIVGALETTASIVQDVLQNGVGALWDHLAEFVGDIKQTVMDGIQSFVAEQLVRAGIDILLKMTNPIGGVIKILETVYDFVMFIRENWDRIFTFAQTVYNTVADIAAGNIGGAAAMLENALAQTIPMILDFLARLLNFDGIVDKIQEILEKIRAPINKGIDKVMDLIIKAAQSVIKGLRGDKGNEEEDEKKNTGEETPEARKDAAKAKLVKLMKAKKTISPQEMNNALVDLKAEFKLSKVQIESLNKSPKVAFYASPATFLPIAQVPISGQKQTQKAKDRQSVKNGDYIKATNYDGPAPSPGKEVVNHLNATFQNQPTGNGDEVVPRIAGNVFTELETSSKTASYHRAGSVEAQSSVARQGRRRGSGETVFGHFGKDEEIILTGQSSTAYNGGHLIGDQIMDSNHAFDLFKAWNLAPQVSKFNSPIYRSSIEAAATKAIRAGGTVKYNVKVQYPNSTYNIKASRLIQNVLPAGNAYRQQLEAAIAHNNALDQSFAMTRRTPGFWQAEAKVIAGGQTMGTGNDGVNPRTEVNFENNPVNVQAGNNYNPTGQEQVAYALEVNQGNGMNTVTEPGKTIKVENASQVSATARQQTF